jgi:hypothetical protein
MATGSQVITANRLSDGRVVFLAEGGHWVEAVGRSRVAESEDSAAALTALAERAVAEREVVAPYLIEVVREGKRLLPRRYREVIRALGPSTHPELGRPDSVTATQQE